MHIPGGHLVGKPEQAPPRGSIWANPDAKSGVTHVVARLHACHSDIIPTGGGVFMHLSLLSCVSTRV